MFLANLRGFSIIEGPNWQGSEDVHYRVGVNTRTLSHVAFCTIFLETSNNALFPFTVSPVRLHSILKVANILLKQYCEQLSL